MICSFNLTSATFSEVAVIDVSDPNKFEGVDHSRKDSAVAGMRLNLSDGMSSPYSRLNLALRLIECQDDVTYMYRCKVKSTNGQCSDAHTSIRFAGKVENQSYGICPTLKFSLEFLFFMLVWHEKGCRYFAPSI